MNCLKERKWAHWKVTIHKSSLDDSFLRTKRRTQGWLVTKYRKVFVQASTFGAWETDAVISNFEKPIIITFKPYSHQEKWEHVLRPLQLNFHFNQWKKKSCPQSPITKKFVKKIKKNTLQQAFLNWKTITQWKSQECYPPFIHKLHPWRIHCDNIDSENQYVVMAQWKWPENYKETFTCACQKPINVIDAQGYSCGHFFHQSCLSSVVLEECPQCNQGKRLNNSYVMLPYQKTWIILDQVFYIIGPMGQYWRVEGNLGERDFYLKDWIETHVPVGNIYHPIRLLSKWYRRTTRETEKWKWMTAYAYYRILPIAWKILCISFDNVQLRVKKLKLISIAVTFVKITKLMKRIGEAINKKESPNRIMYLITFITNEVLPSKNPSEHLSGRIRKDTKTQSKFFENVIQNALHFENLLKQFSHRILEASDCSTKRYLSDMGTPFTRKLPLYNLFFLRNFFQFTPYKDQDYVNHIVEAMILEKFTEQAFEKRVEKRWHAKNFIIVPKVSYMGIVIEHEIETEEKPEKTIYNLQKFIQSIEKTLRIPLESWLTNNLSKLSSEEEKEIMSSI